MLDDEVLKHFRAQDEGQGRGCQTLIDATIREAIAVKAGIQCVGRPLTADVPRKILREEPQAS